MRSRRESCHAISRARGFNNRDIIGQGSGRDEAGAVLILALIFLIVVGGIVGSLATWATNDLNNTAHFTSARSLQYAAESATELAIQSIRYTPLLTTTPSTLNASPPVPCWGGGSPSEPPSVNGDTIVVWCSTTWNPPSAATRMVTFSACPVAPSQPLDAVACAANPYLQANVTFDDYPSGGISAPTSPPVPCTVYCGTTITVNSWSWSSNVPTVSGISPSSTLITGGKPITITGTGFVTGSTVNLVDPNSNNIIALNAPVGVVPATVTAISPTSITAVAPAVPVGATYFVTVTTPGGTSAYSGVDAFTYTSTSVVPAISSISANGGFTFGGTAVFISGIGFYSSPTVQAAVKFVPVSGGGGFTAVSTVIGPSSIEAFSPAVVAAGAYNITVTTAGGTSSTGPVDVFTYTQLQANPG